LEALMDNELVKARFREHGDALETVTKFANELSGDLAKLRDDFERIKSWARGMLAAEIENAGNELRVEIHGVLTEAHETARAKAKAAEDELKAMEALLTTGPAKSVRLVHDSEGRAIGAVVHEH
jgi:hypothetical protein